MATISQLPELYDIGYNMDHFTLVGNGYDSNDDYITGQVAASTFMESYINRYVGGYYNYLERNSSILYKTSEESYIIRSTNVEDISGVVAQVLYNKVDPVTPLSDSTKVIVDTSEGDDYSFGYVTLSDIVEYVKSHLN